MPRQGKFISWHSYIGAFAVVSLLVLLAVAGLEQPTASSSFHNELLREHALPVRFDQTDTTQFLWAGANQYRLWFESARIAQELDAMVKANLKVLRIFLDTHNDEPWESPPNAYTFENPIGNYNDESLRKVDSLMFECQKRGIKMIIALTNSNNPAPYDTIFGTVVDMYRSPQAIQAHKKRFEYFLNHRNALLDKLWKEINDVILAWEIQNEAGIPFLRIDTLSLPVAERYKIIRNFLDTLATHLKSLDPDTYVSLGNAGYAKYYNNGASGDDIRTLGDIKDADIYTLHFFGGNLQQWINDNRSFVVDSLGKLLLVEEFGNMREDTKIIDNYRYVTQLCRQNGIPWMFWRMGHRKDNDWSILDDDPVWQEVVCPEAHAIACIRTEDKWNVNFDSCRTSCRTVAVENEKIGAPQSFQLYQSFPNPVRLSESGQRSTSVSFHLPHAAQVDLRIFDLSGRQVALLLNGPQQSGTHRINWQIENFSAGLYFCRLRSEEFVQTQKLVLVK